ncbi:MAG TPA: amidase [Solirubrobacteraceae bacterium]|nr:amidase [Solirubrobacteraceae bacterium]
MSALAEGRASSLALVERTLADIAATQSSLNAFRVVCARRALADAAKADRRLAAGERLPLLGVPIAVKDDIDVAGLPTAFGCRGEFAPSERDCEMVARLRSAGAVIVGKTNTPELGQFPFTEGGAFGITRNPWSLDHTPGGSSGGAAAAVAAGIVPAAIGSDGAGSVRIPASWCNLVGVKPQRGRISTWPEAESFNGLTCLGPLTRTVADSALLLDVLSGSHPGDLHRPAPPERPYAEALRRDPPPLRIALLLSHPFSAAPVRLHPQVQSAVQRLATRLRELGHTVVPADLRYGMIGLALLACGEAGVHEWVKKVPDRALLDRRTRETAALGGLLSRTLLGPSRRLEEHYRRRIGARFKDFDVALTPTTAVPPLRVGVGARLGGFATHQLIASACPYAWPWNVLGWPALSVPAGLTDSGLPIGAQLLGPADSEALLLALAAQLERCERWAQRLPPHGPAARSGASEIAGGAA